MSISTLDRSAAVRTIVSGLLDPASRLVPVTIPASIMDQLAVAEPKEEIRLDSGITCWSPADAALKHFMDACEQVAQGLEDLIHFLLDQITSTTGSTAGRLVIETVGEARCKLFHVDYIPLRFLMTLWGQGTEWLAPEDANRRGLGHGDNALIIRDPSKVRHLRTGEAALFKGEDWPLDDIGGVIHRAPDPENNALRLLLRIDIKDPKLEGLSL